MAAAGAGITASGVGMGDAVAEKVMGCRQQRICGWGWQLKNCDRVWWVVGMQEADLRLERKRRAGGATHTLFVCLRINDLRISTPRGSIFLTA